MTTVCLVSSASGLVLPAPLQGLAAAWWAAQPLGAAPQHHHHHL